MELKFVMLATLLLSIMKPLDRKGRSIVLSETWSGIFKMYGREDAENNVLKETERKGKEIEIKIRHYKSDE